MSYLFYDRTGKGVSSPLTQYLGASSLSAALAAQMKGIFAYNPATGETFVSDGTVWRVHSNSDWSVMLPAVTPEVGGSPQAKQQFGDSTHDVFYLKATLNAGDDIIAGARLSNSYPDVTLLNPGTQIILRSPTAIERVDLLAVGDTESSSPSAGEIATEASTEVNIRSLMQTFTFDAADDVRLVTLTASERYSLNATSTGAPAPTQNGVMVIVEGRSYA